MKYIEAGFGNTWWIRTEIEHSDGSEVECKGIVRPIRVRSVYLRVWAGKTVWIWDSKEGFKRSRKTRRSWKLVVGLVCYIN